MELPLPKKKAFLVFFFLTFLFNVGFAGVGWNSFDEVRNYALGNAAFLDGRSEAITHINPARLADGDNYTAGLQFLNWKRNWQNNSLPESYMNLNSGHGGSIFLALRNLKNYEWADVAIMAGVQGYARHQMGDFSRDYLRQKHLGIAYAYSPMRNLRLGVSAIGVFLDQPFKYDEDDEFNRENYQDTGIRGVFSAEYDVMSLFRFGLSVSHDGLGSAPLFYEDEFGHILMFDSPPPIATGGLRISLLGYGALNAAVEMPFGSYEGKYYSTMAKGVLTEDFESDLEYRLGLEISIPPGYPTYDFTIDLRGGVQMKKLMLHPEVQVADPDKMWMFISGGLGLNFGNRYLLDFAMGFEPYQSIIEEAVANLEWRENPLAWKASFIYNF